MENHHVIAGEIHYFYGHFPLCKRLPEGNHHFPVGFPMFFPLFNAFPMVFSMCFPFFNTFPMVFPGFSSDFNMFPMVFPRFSFPPSTVTTAALHRAPRHPQDHPPQGAQQLRGGEAEVAAVDASEAAKLGGSMRF